MFPLGRLVMTQGVACLIENEENPIDDAFVHECIQRHNKGDWGDVCDEDKEANDYALKVENRLLSSYKKDGTEIWIITEWDRSVTTVLLPSEY